MTLSPTLTSSGTRSVPLSLKRPGPTARTSPSCGFSLAVSGMTRPDAVVCSASRDWTTMRSSSGLMATDTVVTFPSGQSKDDYGLWALRGWPPSRGSTSLEEGAGTFGSRVPTGRNLGLRLALGQVECQFSGPSRHDGTGPRAPPDDPLGRLRGCRHGRRHGRSPLRG